MPDPPRHSDGTYAESSFRAIYDALDREVRRIDSLRTADQVALVAALLAAKTAVDAALAAAEKAVAAALTAAKEAVSKAEIGQQRTNKSQNEFRQQLKDQAATFLTRNEYDLAHSALEVRVDATDKEIGNLRSRIDIGPPTLPALQSRSDEGIGRLAGSLDTRTVVFAILTLVLTGVLVALYIAKP